MILCAHHVAQKFTKTGFPLKSAKRLSCGLSSGKLFASIAQKLSKALASTAGADVHALGTSVSATLTEHHTDKHSDTKPLKIDDSFISTPI